MASRAHLAFGLLLLTVLAGCGADDPDDAKQSEASGSSATASVATEAATESPATEVSASASLSAGSTGTAAPLPIDDTNAVDVAAGGYVAYPGGIELRVLGVAGYDGGQGLLVDPELPYRVDLELRNPAGPPIPTEPQARMGCGAGYASEALDLLDPTLPALPETVQTGQTVPYSVGLGVLPDAVGGTCVLEVTFSPDYGPGKFLMIVG